ncbi:hypothetical protein CHS0354_014100 [Potamilus streckersoni]|uniref:Uncharacterized protein n=1 Tax=Potamilus streckersoni TaxID=2493646 RepID=A0AAE0TJX6_9BIVA|nr:hypothetical protein CHS0354_014100 [Potamilus streckersoni]
MEMQRASRNMASKAFIERQETRKETVVRNGGKIPSNHFSSLCVKTLSSAFLTNTVAKTCQRINRYK